MNLIKYLINTIATQIRQDIQIVKQIFDFHVQDIRETMELTQTKNMMKKRMKLCKNYQQWLQVAKEFDNLLPNQIWREKVYSRHYDYLYIRDLTALMKETRRANQIQKLVAILRSHSFRNIGNINCPLMYRECYHHTKSLIEEFQKQISKSLKAILKSTQLNLAKKIEFFSEMRHAIGRTAILLSGGALMGMYHIGVLMALKEAGIVPRIVAGSSAGSILASCLAVRGLDENYTHYDMNYSAWQEAGAHGIFYHVKRWFKQGFFMDIKVLQKFLRDNIGDYTFQQAYDKTGWILNITVTGAGQHHQNRLLNYLTAPNVLIWSASAASCALPYIFGEIEIYCKNADGQIETYVPFDRKFVDGTIGSDLPMDNLSVLFNVNSFVVSQTNPWVTPFMDYTDEIKSDRHPLIARAISALQTVKEMILAEFKHRLSQIRQMGFIPNKIQKVFNLFSQSYVGSVTIWPKPKLVDYMNILKMPSKPEELDRFVEVGRERTYPKISLIRAMMHFETQVDKCLKRAKFISQSRLNLGLRVSQHSVAQKDSFDDQDKIIQRDLLSRKKLIRNSSFMNPREFKHN